MALPLIPLLLGGLFAGNKVKRGFERKDRRRLQEGVQDALGFAPGFGLDPDQFGSGGLENLFQSAGSGLLADPQDQKNQLQFATTIMGLPGGGDFGQSLIEQSLGFGQRDTEQTALFGQQDKSQDNLFTFNREENRLDRDQRLTIANQKAEQLRINNEAKAQALVDENPFGLGNQATGTRRVDLGNGQLADIPLRDTPRYTDAVTELDTFERAVTDVDAMITSIEKSGSEFFGIESGQQALAYGQILAHMAQLRELGVLQKSDIEFMQDALTDPSGIDGMFTGNKRMIEGYKTAQRFFQDKLREANQKYALWGIGSELETTTPRQIEEQRQQQILADSAAALGLTLTGATVRPDPPLTIGTIQKPTLGGRGQPGQQRSKQQTKKKQSVTSRLNKRFQQRGRQ